MSDTIIIDNGSFKIKSGFAGEEKPSYIFTNRVGTPKIMGDPFRIGEDVFKYKKLVKERRTVEFGVIVNYGYIEKLWEHTFKELKVKTKGKNVVLLSSAQTPKLNKEKTTQIMFESFSFGGMNLL